MASRSHYRATTCFLLLMVTSTWSHPLTKRKPQSQLPLGLGEDTTPSSSGSNDPNYFSESEVSKNTFSSPSYLYPQARGGEEDIIWIITTKRPDLDYAKLKKTHAGRVPLSSTIPNIEIATPSTRSSFLNPYVTQSSKISTDTEEITSDATTVNIYNDVLLTSPSLIPESVNNVAPSSVDTYNSLVSDGLGTSQVTAVFDSFASSTDSSHIEDEVQVQEETTTVTPIIYNNDIDENGEGLEPETLELEEYYDLLQNLDHIADYSVTTEDNSPLILQEEFGTSPATTEDVLIDSSFDTEDLSQRPLDDLWTTIADSMDPLEGQDQKVSVNKMWADESPDDNQATSPAAGIKDQLQDSVAEKVKNITVKLNLEHFKKPQANDVEDSSSPMEVGGPEETSVVNRLTEPDAVKPAIENMPYVAFNIWSYEEGELKLSAVKKIPAEEVLGTDFYSQVTNNPSEPVIVLSDSFVIDNRNSSMPKVPQSQPITSAVTATTTTSTTSTTESSSFTDQMNFVHVGLGGMENHVNQNFMTDDETLDLVLNSDSNLSDYFPKPLVSPITNVYDLVSFIISNTSETSAGKDAEAEVPEHIPVYEVILNTEEVMEPVPVPSAEQMPEIEQIEEEEYMPEMPLLPVPEVEPMPVPMPEVEPMLEIIPEPEPEPEMLFESTTQAENIRQEQQTSPTTEVNTARPLLDVAGEASLNSVMLSPQGVKLASSLDDSVKADAIKLLSAINDHSLMFNINESSATPHKIQVSLINDEGVPTNETSLINADLISIISNKPTIINHNIYQIVQGGYLPGNNNGNINNDVSLSKPQLLSTTQEISDQTQALYPSLSAIQNLHPTKDAFIPTQTQLSAEEQLLLELEQITSFNKILSGSATDAINDASIIETLALKGILDAKPEFVNLATEQIPGVDINDQTFFAPNTKPNYAPYDPSGTFHHLQLNILPLGSSSSSFPNGSLVSPTPSSENTTADLGVLEHLLENNQLPTEVEIAILSDILAGSSISGALETNLKKFKHIIAEHAITEHIKLHLPHETSLSPLSVIDAIEGNRKYSGNSSTPSAADISSSSHTFITEVNVATLPPVRAATGAAAQSPSVRNNLSNCFQDKACTFAFSLALAAGTTGALTVPFITPLIGRGMKSSVAVAKAEIPNELMTVDDAKRIMAAVTKYAQRDGKSMRGRSHKQLRGYLSPYISYLGHKMFPRIFGELPHQKEE